MEVDMQREIQNLKLDITILHGVMEKIKNMEPCQSYHRMQEYENMKINNVIFGEK